jgi:hypothetical protein
MDDLVFNGDEKKTDSSILSQQIKLMSRRVIHFIRSFGRESRTKVNTIKKKIFLCLLHFCIEFSIKAFTSIFDNI